MKKRFLQMTALLLVLMLAAAVFPSMTAQAANKRIGTVTATVGLRVRDAAGTVGTNHVGWLSYGTVVTILDDTTVDGVVWYKINGNADVGNVTGWSSGEYITVREIVLDGTYEEYLASQGFPESYHAALTELHALFPNWDFEAVQTGLEWKDAVAAESRPGMKLVWRNSPSHYIDWNDPYINVGRDGYNWVQASKNIVAYYMDPRNFLSDPYIFMFESQAYNAQAQTLEGVEAIIGHSFMGESNTFEVDGVTYTHAQAILEAAAESGVSAYHLASRMLQEQGTTGSRLSLGSVPNYEGVYNYFNIGAYPANGNDSEINGAIYAQGAGWTDPLASIKGGAKILGSYYINDGQDTVYFQNFNVVSDSPYTHQYMTNVQAGETESKILRNAYTEQTVQMSLVFRIPVYENMPKMATSPFAGAWVQNEVGWWYDNGDGTWPAAQWAYIDGNWYYFNEGGYRVTGWHYIGGSWFYMNTNGVMHTGWLLDGDLTYYLNSDGRMAVGWQDIDNGRYYFNASGERMTDWQVIDGKTYYLGQAGKMQVGWLELENKHYYFDSEGVRVSGWQVLDGAQYFFDDAGVRQSGWLDYQDKRFYLDTDGRMQVGWLLLEDNWYYLDGGVVSYGWQNVNGVWYWLDEDGVMLTGWLLDGGRWFYLQPGGAMATGWVLDGNTWYYMDASGVMQTGWVYDGGRWYYLNPNGAMATGWLYDGGRWYYLNPNGAMATGWVLDGGRWFYLNASGAMVTGPTRIDGKVHLFNASGVWLG